MKKLLTEKFSIRILITGIIILFISLLLFMWNDWNFSTLRKIDYSRFTNFSDFVGGLVGPIFALVGVILFYVALTEQRKDFDTNRAVLEAQTKALQQQILEFELQREELSETRKVFQLQNETFKKQQFESTFFNLLNLHHQIINSINLTSKMDKYPGFEKYTLDLSDAEKKEKIIEITTGRDCFVLFGQGFKNTYKSFKKDNPVMAEFDIVRNSYWKYFERHQSDLGHYFRNLYHIFKFIKNSEEKEKGTYTSLVRAQLSNDELFMLFYNCVSDLGNEKFLPLVEEFHLLKNLNTDTLIDYELHCDFFKKGAY